VSPVALPFAPRRIVIGANAHAELTTYLRERRPELDIRGARLVDITQGDLDWGETYIGFRRPPGASTLGNVRWVHCTGAGVDAWMSPEISRDVILTRTPESFGPAIAEWAVTRVLAFQQQLADVMQAQR
jgi:phosphoglycerate dehydrogenase-like enzyme